VNSLGDFDFNEASSFSVTFLNSGTKSIMARGNLVPLALKLKLGDEMIINDGQHRCAGISAAIKENPKIGRHRRRRLRRDPRRHAGSRRRQHRQCRLDGRRGHRVRAGRQLDGKAEYLYVD
jgi:hypothetical protein